MLPTHLVRVEGFHWINTNYIQLKVLNVKDDQNSSDSCYPGTSNSVTKFHVVPLHSETYQTKAKMLSYRKVKSEDHDWTLSS